MSRIGPDLQHVQVTRGLAHEATHKGATFSISHLFPGVSGSVAAALWFRSGAEEPNLNYYVAAGGEAEVYFYEAPTLSASGTALGAINLNRTLLHGTGLLAWHSPAITATGTFLCEHVLPGGTGAVQPGGTVQSETEWLLRANTAYLLLSFNRAAGAESSSIEIGFYEE